MKRYVHTSKLDKTGRIVLPSEIRQFLGYDDGTRFEVDYHSDGSITLMPTVALHECPTCGSMVHIDRLKGQK